MPPNTRQTTIHMDPTLHKALKLKAKEISTSISGLVNDAIRASLTEDEIDIAVCEIRAEEPLVSYSDMVARLKNDGIL